MNPVEKMNELQRRVDAVNHRVIVYFVYHLHLQAASCAAIAGLLLLNAGIMKNKKSKS